MFLTKFHDKLYTKVIGKSVITFVLFSGFVVSVVESDLRYVKGNDHHFGWFWVIIRLVFLFS